MNENTKAKRPSDAEYRGVVTDVVTGVVSGAAGGAASVVTANVLAKVGQDKPKPKK